MDNRNNWWRGNHRRHRAEWSKETNKRAKREFNDNRD